MKLAKNLFQVAIILIIGLPLLMTSCEESVVEDDFDFEVGTIDAAVSAASVSIMDTVTFSDLSTLVVSRKWTFEGASISTSTDSVVSVTYEWGGTYLAILAIRHFDDEIRTKEFTIIVDGPTEEEEEEEEEEGGDNVPKFGLYTEKETTLGAIELSFTSNNQFLISDATEGVYEGATAKSFVPDPAFGGDKTWAMASIQPAAGGTVDISAYADGYFNIAMKSSSDGTILFRLQQGGTRAILTFNATDELYGFARDGEWHQLQIPMADFLAVEPAINLTEISDLLVFRSDGDVSAANNYEFYMDNFYLSNEKEEITTPKFSLFTETEGTLGSAEVSFTSNNQFLITDETEGAYEGSIAKAFIPDPDFGGDKSWAMASIQPTAGSIDISEYANGYFNIAMKSSSDGTFLWRLQQGGTRAILTFNATDELYGFVRDGEWHQLKIPMSDFLAAEPAINLAEISDLLVFRSDGDVTAANNYEFYIDNFYLSLE